VRRAIVLLCVVGLLAVGGGTYRAVQDARRADACAPFHALATIELPSAGQVGSAYSAGTVSSAASAEDQLLTPVPWRPRKLTPKGSPYLVVYPFVKVRPWYSLTEDERQRAMDEHIAIGREEFPGIKNHTSYSFGIDDQEFMTAFECDEPADFMHLMLRLRDSEASRYTERDTPIFVGRHVTIREALAALDGASARVVS